jgi:HK97 family phage portal protein
VANWLSRLSRFVVRQTEGAFRPGPYQLPVTGGWLSAQAGQYTNWWQLGYDPLPPSTQTVMVEACVSAYSQTVAMCPGDHWRTNEKGGRDRVTNSALARVLRYPNEYETISDFLLNAVRQLYLTGNAYALCLRNDRFEIDELHLMKAEMSWPRLAYNGEIFYDLRGNDVIMRRMGEGNFIVPKRDVLHIKLHTLRQRFPVPLIGESPICSAYESIAANQAILQQQAAFYRNEARPSAVLTTDQILDKDQVTYIRDRWDQHSKDMNRGGTPILTAGLKVQPWSMGGRDASTAEILKLTNENIALAYRIPLQILGLSSGPFSSTETLMQSWIASGLGFCLNHVEEAIGVTFQLKGQPDEYVEFDTAALLRSQFKDRIEGLARGVQTGIFAPNEARNLEALPDVKFGDEPRVQQQVVPLSAAAGIPSAPPAPPAGPPGAPVAVPKPQPQRGITDADRVRVRRQIRAAVLRQRHRLTG